MDNGTPRGLVEKMLIQKFPSTLGSALTTSHKQQRTEMPRNIARYYLPMDISGRFGVRLRTLRHERNLTQLRMSIEFGIDRSYISDVERGRKAISLPMLEVIALGMKMTLSDLLQDI